MKVKKKLIEVALPLEAINEASVREGYIYRGNPSALHKWWAQRPLAAARAVIFAQMVDDPSSLPDLFPTQKKQEKERQRLFRLIEDLVVWENTTAEKVLQPARDEIWQSWRRACAENADHPRAKDLFDRSKLPMFHDPFAGGGTLPLEAQRLGLEAYASDLNPVAVLINKAMIEIPPKFTGRPPVHPVEEGRGEGLLQREWKGAQGLAEDVRHYGKWMRDEAEKRIGHHFPNVSITAEIAEDRRDLKPYIGKEIAVIAWLWARTVKSPNPAFANVDVPLAATFMLSTKAGKERYVEPVIENGGYRFVVRAGKPNNAEQAKNGTKLARGANFRCVMSGTPIASDHIYTEAQAGRMGARLMAIVAEGDRGRVYIAPTPEHEAAARKAKPEWKPDVAMPENPRAFSPPLYGLKTYGDLFTPRQLVALKTFSDLVVEARERIRDDAVAAGMSGDPKALRDSGTGATAYADALGVYLAFAQDKTAEYGCTLVPWYNKEDRPKGLFARHAIPMVWDYAEVNPLSDIGGSFSASVGIVAGALAGCAADGPPGRASQGDAVRSSLVDGTVVSTDPPYYDNIGYADLSDFFYSWMRSSQRSVFPELFATLAVPKAEELVATPYRHGSKQNAERFFLDGMTQAMDRIAGQAHPSFPITIYYAFKQSESRTEAGIANTGWETFLDAVVRSGFAISGTWPIRTERGARVVGIGTNALASSIIIVCRKRTPSASVATRREFIAALKGELPQALADLQRSNIAPVDLAQAAIGPGMAVFTRYSKVLDAAAEPMRVREALALINEVLDEALGEQEGDFDADSRWALAWFEEHGFTEGNYGRAEQLSKSKNTSVAGLVEAGILFAKRGTARLLKPDELTDGWDPSRDTRLTAWESVHHLVRALNSGEQAAADLVRKLGSYAETARELAYRLYILCERKKRATEALAYNGLVQSWPEIVRLAKEGESSHEVAPQSELFEEE